MATFFDSVGDSGLGETTLSAYLGGSGAAAAGDIYMVVAVGTAAGDGLTEPTPSTNLGGSGWVKLVDLNVGAGADEIRATWWSLICAGGEDTVNVDWTAPSDVCMQAVKVGTPTLPLPYVVGSGELVWQPSPGRMFFDAGNPSGDHQSYLMLAATGDVNIDNIFIVAPPGNSGGTGTQLSDECGAWANWSDNEGAHHATDDLRVSATPQMDDGALVAFFGFSTNPGELSGTGHFLGGSGELTAEPPSLLSGTGHFLGGRGRITAPTPFPIVPNEPPYSGQLQCGVYDVFVFTRGLGQIVGRIPFNQLQWTRVLDDTSTAEITINGVSNAGSMQRCCQLLGSINPWEHEVGIYRNGWRVWSGPVVHMSYPSETVVIDAADLSAWLGVRELHYGHNDVQQDLADIWVEYVLDAMSVDDSCGLHPSVTSPTGVVADRLYTPDMGVVSADAIAELARTGLDWYTIDRRMVGGPVAVQPLPFPDAPPLPTLIDESFRDAPTVDRDGTLMGNCWFVGGSGAGPGGNSIFGEYGPEFPATDDHVAQPAAPDYAAIEAKYGRIERRVNETKILDQPSIDQNAATRYDLTKRPVDVISSGTLLPTAGIDIRQLIPGSLQQIHLSRACVQIGEPYRLKQLTVTAQSDGAEQVEGSWEPVGSVAAHEDLG